ncbi:MAG: DUF922 domain-containing protein [Hyphomicrobiaceae bacterium]|nr:DUF922 domain-containing protein [Hyphomicrobiaceae bacterium]
MKKACLAGALAVVFAAAVSLVGAYSGGIAATTAGLGTSRAVEKINWYDIGGATLEELRKEVFTRGPYDKFKGQRFAGWTEWRIQWWFERRSVPQGCAPGKAVTETRITYTLPRWAGADGAPPELNDTWKRFVEALRLHEEGHGRLARELAGKIELAIESMPPEPTCEELEHQVGVLANRMILEDKEQIAYDVETGHGHSQGAAFPRVVVRAHEPLDGPSQERVTSK